MSIKFKSQLGDIIVEEDRFERKKAGDWENILAEYPEQKILDKMDYSQITGLKLEKGSINPCIKIQLNNEEWRYVFFQVNDPVEKVWNRLRYMWQSYVQNH